MRGAICLVRLDESPRPTPRPDCEAVTTGRKPRTGIEKWSCLFRRYGERPTNPVVESTYFGSKFTIRSRVSTKGVINS